MGVTYRHIFRSEQSQNAEVVNLTRVITANIFAAPTQTAGFFTYLFSQQPRSMRPVYG